MKVINFRLVIPNLVSRDPQKRRKAVEAGFVLAIRIGDYFGKEILPLSVEKLGQRIFYLRVGDNDGRASEHRALVEGTIR